jgi:nitrilase
VTRAKDAQANKTATIYTVAAVQAAPVFLDREATVAKAIALIAEAAKGGAHLVVFPEAFIPSYPEWAWAVPPADGGTHGRLYARLLEHSVTVPSAATDALGRAARDAGVYVVIGINERNSAASGGSLYNSLLYIGPEGRILGVHRKLVPTLAERLIWAQGDGSTLDVYDTPFGRLGGLICWENYMPLARYTMYARGVQVYVAATWDRGEPWLSTLRHIAKEGQTYVIGCSIALRTSDIDDPQLLERYYADFGEWINEGDSAIVDPSGTIIAGPANKTQEILYARVDRDELSASKWRIDVAGHYARPDVFSFAVRTEPNPIMTLDNGAAHANRGHQEPAKQPLPNDVESAFPGVRKQPY